MIILAILKIIGIVLLCVIAFAVLLLLLFLFVPVTYNIKVKGDGTDITARAGVKWFLGVLSAGAELVEKDVIYKIKVFGITIKKGKAGEKKDDTPKDGKHKTDKNKNGVQEDKAPEADEKNFGERVIQNNREETEKKSGENRTLNYGDETGVKVEAILNRKPEIKITEKELERKKQERKKHHKEGREKKVSKKERKTSLKDKIKNLYGKAKDVKQKASQIKRALDTRTGRRAVALVKAQSFKLLRHIKPKVVEGSLIIGMEDPAATAEVFGIVSQVAYLISDGRLSAEPDLDRKIIKPDITVKGRMLIFCIAAAVLKMILNTDVSRIWKEIRRITNG